MKELHKLLLKFIITLILAPIIIILFYIHALILYYKRKNYNKKIIKGV